MGLYIHRKVILRYFQKLFLFSLIIPTIVSLANVASARNISMVTVEWAPHYGADLPENGLTTALVKAAFKAAGHNAEVGFIPWKRALKEVREGLHDVVMGAYYNEDRARIYHMSDPIYSLDLVFIARPGLGIRNYDSLQDLKKYRIGISRGFANSEEFDSADYLDKHIATTPTLNIRKLFRGRIDLAVMNYDLFRYNANREGFCVGNVEFLEPPLDTPYLHIMASREVGDGGEIINDFNNGLKAIKESGEYLRIFSRFRK